MDKVCVMKIKMLLKIVGVLCCVRVLNGQSASICPFSYRVDGGMNSYFGFVELVNLRPGQSYNLRIILSIAAAVTSQNIGSIQPFVSREQTSRDVLLGRPVQLRVNFPFRNPIPTVIELSLNNVALCQGPSVQGEINRIRLDYNIPAIYHERNTVAVSNRDLSSDAGCGKRQIKTQELLLQGYNSVQGQWPWHTAIYHLRPKQRLYACGGTLIGEYQVLTAAHCVTETSDYELSPDALLIQFGVFDLDLLSPKSLQEHKVRKITIHPGFEGLTHKNDLAVLSLATKVRFTPYVQPACLYSENDIETFSGRGVVGSLVGWGRIEGQARTNILKEATLPFVSFSDCLDSNRDVFGEFLSAGMFCAGRRNGTNVCDGDSGGGFFINQFNAWYLVGIVSFTALNANRECSAEDYAVFVDISKYLDWIFGITGILINSQPHSVFTTEKPLSNFNLAMLPTNTSGVFPVAIAPPNFYDPNKPNVTADTVIHPGQKKLRPDEANVDYTSGNIYSVLKNLDLLSPSPQFLQNVKDSEPFRKQLQKEAIQRYVPRQWPFLQFFE